MKILLITTCFPYFDIQEDGSPTKFLYYYAAEWVKQGHEVLVLHSVRRYPRIFSMAIEFFEKKLGLKLFNLSRFKQNAKAVRAAAYEIDGIRVIRTPIRKLIPHRDYLRMDLVLHRKKVLQQYKELGFRADVVISDYLTPSAYIADEIRRKDSIQFFQVLHQTDFNYLRRVKVLRHMFNQASGVLYRSYSHGHRLMSEGLKMEYQDYMFTGIPDNTKIGEPRIKIKKLLFVGVLRYSKNIHVILQAMAASKGNGHYELEIVGDGEYREQLVNLVNKLGLQQQVFFSGRLSREQVFERMRHADCFVMVSKETFGMVYIEALSQGCIVIAAKDQGVDGIIVDGENGFLAECGVVKGLTELLDRLMLLDQQDIERISGNGLRTAAEMTDGSLARTLLERLRAYLKAEKRI